MKRVPASPRRRARNPKSHARSVPHTPTPRDARAHRSRATTTAHDASAGRDDSRDGRGTDDRATATVDEDAMTATATEPAPEDGAANAPEDEDANAPNETGGANAPSSARAVEPKVREDLLAELTEIMGFNRNKAVRALYFSQADSAERAIDWIERHEEDADVNEPLLIEDESSAAKGVKTVSKMTAEEAKAKADELRRNAAAKKAERLLEEREMERLREQERIRSGKELTEAKKLEDELSLKRNIEQRRAEKEEMDRARAAIRVKIDEDRRERRRKLGLPEEMTPEELEEERKREEAKAKEMAEEIARKAAAGMYVKPVSKLELLRKHLVDIKKTFIEDLDAVTTCFKTLLTYLGNIARAPSEEKYRSIKMSNAAFQQRVAAVGGEIYLLEFGFRETVDAAGDKRLVLASEDADPVLLRTAGEELHGAINNPFFGTL